MPDLVYMDRPDTAPQWFMDTFGAHGGSIYDESRRYRSSTVFYHNLYGSYHDRIEEQLDRGHRVIFDMKNEHYLANRFGWIIDGLRRRPGQGMIVVSGQTAVPMQEVKIIATPYWYWIMDQRAWQVYGLDTWQPAPDYRYSFLMLMGQNRPDREFFFDYLRIHGMLANALYSYLGRDILLPDDLVHDNSSGNWSRWINKNWIDQTRFSVAVETYIQDDYKRGISLTLDDNLFLCEKSYRAMACQHPFLLVSTYRNLAYLRSQGFETFPELFDERYDDESNWCTRVMLIMDNIKKFDDRSIDRPGVREKIRHNHARFFDRDLVQTHQYETIVKPIMEWIS